MYQSSHKQGPFLRDAGSTEEEGLLHEEALSLHGERGWRAGRLKPGSSPVLPADREGAASRGCLLAGHLPEFLGTGFSFCYFFFQVGEG